MIVTIDGPAGSGKSTVARELAARLQIPYLDTGAMYRAVAHAALERGVDVRDERALVRLAQSLELALDCGPTHTRVWVSGHDVTEAIRTMPVSAVISHVAKCPAIRELLIAQQRRLGQTLGSFVSEGRDQGAVVFPNASAKFILDASLQRRAERRHRELVAGGEVVDLTAVMQDLRARDRVDSTQWEPLRARGEVVVIDTTDMTIRQVVDRMMELLGGRGSPSSGPPG